ncbi:tRNA dimethylallyltransferase 9 [Neltuma alba]|uniref:tRNA dimethylallyltransferase 9 n=1 Tax=Neltuma alba TaxID=207710 RepID=UPI0010A4A81C|nr:tRNA dimethylallyltransferase 9-like [Prosopis alba]
MISGGVCSFRMCCSHLHCFSEKSLLRPARFSFTCRRRLLATASSFSGANKKDTKEKVIVISGPTGSGKSRLALELAKRLNGEIISADSVQVYQGLDVGSAKPSKNDRKEVPHHLVDILHPSEDYSVGRFFEDARQATRCILDNGHVPIVVGGTGLYLRWFIYGKPDVPKASPETTSEAYLALGELERNGQWDAAVQLVVEAGDPKAQFITPNDWYRLRRSLEIIKSSGSPPSAFGVPYEFFREQGDASVMDNSGCSDGNANCAGMKETSSNLDYEFMCFFLSTRRLDLYRSIDYRCEDMLLERDGLLSEAQWLLNVGLHPNSNSATKAIGYRQAMDYLVRCREQGGQSSVREFFYFLTEFQKASRNFAKRQLTWFRNEHIYHWLDASRRLDTILDFIYRSYHDNTGAVIVPEHLRMSRDASNGREANELKAYRSKNRLFLNKDDCSPVLEWIRRTQG